MKSHAIQYIGKTLPNEVLIELGRIVDAWIELDICLDRALDKLAGMDGYMDSRFAFRQAQNPFPQRLQTFGTYCSQLALEFPHLRNCRRVHERLKAAHQLRNRYLERSSVPHVDQGEAEACTQTPLERVDAEDLRRVSQEINRAHEALYALVFRPGTGSV